VSDTLGTLEGKRALPGTTSAVRLFGCGWAALVYLCSSVVSFMLLVAAARGKSVFYQPANRGFPIKKEMQK